MLPKPVKTNIADPHPFPRRPTSQFRCATGSFCAPTCTVPREAETYPTLLQRIPYGKHAPRYRSMYLDPMRALAEATLS